MDHKKEWRYIKFANLLNTDEQKERLFQVYKGLDLEKQKLLFLFLNFEESKNHILFLLRQEGVLTFSGIIRYIFQEQGLFPRIMEFKCKNPDCKKYDEIKKSEDIMYNLCPSCDEKIIYLNKFEIYKTFFALYLNYFDFYLLNDSDKTMYVIRNKFNGKHYIKSSDEALANWIFLKLIDNNCDVNKFLFSIGHSKSKNVKNNLLNLIKSKGLITLVDNLNFKPILDPLFIEDNKKYFNLYSGNKYLNLVVSDDEKIKDYENNFPNIRELMFNLTGRDENGVQYLLDVLSMVVQEPHIKTKQLIIFYGEEASGKGTFYDLVLSPLLNGYITKILGKKVKSQFNSYMSQNLALVLEEVKSDKDEEDTMKELVTEDTILINPKGQSERYENNYLTIFGFSNEQNPISAGKRRGVYFNSRTLGGTTDKAPEFRKRFEKEIPKEFEDFVKYLKLNKYNRVEVMKGFETEAKKQVVEQNLSAIERFYYELTSFPSIARYIDNLIDSNQLDINYNLEKYLHKSKDVVYVQSEFILLLYNTFLKKIKYNSITLNKFGEFWQLVKINRDDKGHWNRLVNPNTGGKTSYVNLNMIDEVIKARYEND